MRYSFVLTCVILFLITACSNEKNEVSDFAVEEVEKNLVDLPDILQGLPVKIEVRNEPKQVKAMLDPKDSAVFIWKIKTYLKSGVANDLTILEFGDYAKDESGAWYLHNYTGKPFKAKEFNEWYFIMKEDAFTWKNAKEGVIEPGKQYLDPVNWTERTDSMHYQTGIWYFIAIDSDGNKVCGYDWYENLPELANGK